MTHSFRGTLREGSEFFMKRGKVHQAMERITRKLNKEKIPYAVIGGMALAAHGYDRFTDDVDLLTTPEGLDRIHERLIGRGYVPPFTGARKALRDTVNGVKIEFITTGEYPGDGLPKPVRFPNPADVAVEHDGYNVISLPKLIELKLASGLTNPLRIRDLADVQDLIVTLDLPRELAAELDPSVRDEYERRWQLYQTSKSSK